MSFELRKFSKLKNPSAHNSSWIHHPERSELLLVFEKEALMKLKVIWRYSIFEQIEFPYCNLSSNDNILSVNHKFPYISFKYSDSNKTTISRFQVSFYTKLEFTKCLNYIESELNISVKEVLAPLILSSILKNRDSFIAVTQDTFPCLSQAENVYSQSYSQSYLVDSQLHTQTLPRYSNIQRGSFISAEDFLMIETLLETNLSLTGDAGVAAESTIAEVSELDLLATMSDEYLKQKVIDKLGDPEFIKFVERIDKLLEKNGINPSV